MRAPGAGTNGEGVGGRAHRCRSGATTAARTLRSGRAPLRAGNAQAAQHFATTELGDTQRAAVEVRHDPLLLACQGEERSPERAAEMVAAFAPVEATEG